MEEEPDAFLDELQFKFYSLSEIRKLSVRQLTVDATFDKFTGKGITGGLYDGFLGVTSERDVCMHCNLGYWLCPGHVGHIEFPRPMYNPVLFGIMIKLLNSFCFKCHSIPIDRQTMNIFVALGYDGPGADTFDLGEVPLYKSKPARELRLLLMNLLCSLNRGCCAQCHKPSLILSHIYSKQILARSSTGRTRKSKVTETLKEFDVDAPAQPKRIKRHSVSDNEEASPARTAKRGPVVHFDDFGNEISLPRGTRPMWDSDDEDSAPNKTSGVRVKAEAVDEIPVSEVTEQTIEGLTAKDDKIILPDEFRDHLRQLWASEHAKLVILFPFLSGADTFTVPTDIFFMDAILVSAPYCRPQSEAGGMTFVHPETANLERVIRQSNLLKSVLESKVDDMFTAGRQRGAVVHGTVTLQQVVNACLDSNLDRSVQTQLGLKQRIEKKEGLFRMHMMGKRVNYACRSVISPDPNLAVDEIGIPEVFARNLTFPEPVSPWNVTQLREMVERGKDSYPGAVSIILPTGQTIQLPKERKRRLALATQYCIACRQPGEPTTIVNRHVLPGDMFLMNRQPTLHRPSMQTHKARILSAPGAKTLRMHYSNCKAYNADFDGDEMNGHFMQTFAARAEAQYITSVPNNYLVPKDGTPLAGLIQDHVIAGVKLTLRDRFLPLDDYLDLVYHSLYSFNLGRIQTLPPAIWHPKQLWTGKQVVSTIIINLTPKKKPCPNLTCQGKKSLAELWAGSKDPVALSLADVNLVIRQGHMLTGMLDKSHIGASKNGLVHSFYEMFGPDPASRFLTGITRLVNRFLLYASFSMGLKDILLDTDADENRRRQFRDVQTAGPASFASAFRLKGEDVTHTTLDRLYRRAQFDKEGTYRKLLEEWDRQLKTRLQKVQDAVCDCSIPNGLYARFPANNLQFMIQSGAKGGMVNAQQMSVGLGQIELEGKRVPLMLSGRTLPSFRPYDTTPRAGGLCTHRFLTGMPPQELFFHSMAGRDGLVDTAVKTSRSGYLQRSLIKHLEDIMIQYDGTVRNSANQVVQFRYGDDGVDINKTALLRPDGFLLMANNKDLFLPITDLVPDRIRDDVINPLVKDSIKDVYRKNKKLLRREGVNKSAFKSLVTSKLALSQAPPGEMVGLLASQSIGEPSTQMTLNTFHLAGKGDMNVTLGIPRLREILMTDSGNITTPCMSVPILNTPTARARAEKVLIRKFNKLFLKDVMKLPVMCSLNSLQSSYTLTFRLKSYSTYKHLTTMKPNQVLHFIETTFFGTIAKTLKSQIKARLKEKVIHSMRSAAEPGTKAGRKEGGDEAEREGDIEMPEPTHEWNEEDGADVNKQRDADEESDFAGEDEELREIGRGGDDDSGEEEGGGVSEEEDGDEGGEMGGAEEVKAQKSAALNYQRVQCVLSRHSYFTAYTYDVSKKPKWCRLTITLDGQGVGFDINSLIMSVINRAVVYSVKGIEKAILDKEKWVMHTEGINFDAFIREWETFDLSKMYTNNIVVMMERYGIEAARASICKEVVDVFGHYGIHVNPRHLSLISDYLTMSGRYRAFNRHYLSQHPSTMQKMTFETASMVLKDALVYSYKDDLSSPSSSIVTGQLVGRCGNKGFDLISVF